MAWFLELYEKVLNLSTHRHASYYLAGVSFAESSVFPIPPDVMLIPMLLSQPFKAKQLFVITTLASILGGILGYYIGIFAFELIGEPMIQTFGYQVIYKKCINWFDAYGFLAVLIAGFTPIPYKLFTIAAGVAQMPLLPFIFASIIGRSIRFFMVTWFVYKLGKKIEFWIIHNFKLLSGMVLFCLLMLLLYWYR